MYYTQLKSYRRQQLISRGYENRALNHLRCIYCTWAMQGALSVLSIISDFPLHSFSIQQLWGNGNRSTTGTDHAYVECLVKDRVWSITISQVQWHGIDKIVFDPRHTSYCSLYFVYVRCVAIAICCIITQTTSPTSHNPTSHLATQVKHTTYLRSTCVHDRLSITCRRAQV